MKNAIPASGLIVLAGLFIGWARPAFGQIPPKPPVVKVQKPPQPKTPVPLKPDLAITGCSVTPSTVAQNSGQFLVLALRYENKGMGPAAIQSQMPVWRMMATPQHPELPGSGAVNVGAAYNIGAREKRSGGVDTHPLRSLPPGT